MDQSAVPNANPLTWSVRLHESAPQKRYGIALAAIAAALAGHFLLGHPLYAFIGFFAILGSTTEFWMPIRYVMDEKGASARCGISVSAIEWADVKRALVFEKSIKLSPLETESRLSEFRGVTFRYGDRREDIIGFVKEKVGDSCLIFGEKT